MHNSALLSQQYCSACCSDISAGMHSISTPVGKASNLKNSIYFHAHDEQRAQDRQTQSL
jgi:hypothetical protein